MDSFSKFLQLQSLDPTFAVEIGNFLTDRMVEIVAGDGGLGDFAPNCYQNLPVEIVTEIVDNLSEEDVCCFVAKYLLSGEVCMSFLSAKLSSLRRNLTATEQSTSYRTKRFAMILSVMNFLISTGRVNVETPFLTDDDDGYCYLKETREMSWMTVAYHQLGAFPTPRDVYAFYLAQTGQVGMPECKKTGSCVFDFSGGGPEGVNSYLTVNCSHCLISYSISASQDFNRHASSVDGAKLILKEVVYREKFHVVGIGDSYHLDRETTQELVEKFGDFNYVTMFHLRELECYFTAAVGSTVIDLDDEDNSELTTIKSVLKALKVEKKLDEEKIGMEQSEYKSQGTSKKPESTIMPSDSASLVTPRPTVVGDQRNLGGTDTLSFISTQMAKLTADLDEIKSQRRDIVGNYTKFEYDLDLQDAFESSGMVQKDGQLFIRPFAHTSASELVPKMTVDDRLNFLIRLHTAIFKVIENSPDYPRPGFMIRFKRLTDGKLKDDHPSLDLLQIVMTDTIDWAHMMVKNNNFGLPVLESGMQLNERILALCLISLKTEYFTRWSCVMKDCIIPSDISDTSRWSDAHDQEPHRRVTSRRPDLARNSRTESRVRYTRQRRDSMFSFLN